ncbi:unnamed protein product [Mytilus edulis]|uniref:Uncharacterized protein n=1 Tax=Mytilus edulis TaxID=6550 RepID=A0A8S3V677_MYTED|nr:unnamed protein product [Mytilus edulis]
MNADKRNIPENEPMEKKNFAISANVPTVESKIIVDNAKMVTGKSRENENQNKATECVTDGQVKTQVRTQTTPSTESEGQVRIQTAQSAEASYNLALKQWQKQNLCKTKTSDLQKTNTDDPYHQTHQQLKTQNSGRNIEMDSSNKKNCDSCLEALEENSTRSENIHSANTKNSDPSLEALAQSSVRSMNIHSSRKKNCDPCLEAQKQNSASSMNIHSNAKNHDPSLEAHKQSSANSMNIHSNQVKRIL